MPSEFIGVAIPFAEVNKYFDRATGRPKGDFDHFDLVPSMVYTSTTLFNIALDVYAVTKDGKVLNNENPIATAVDTSSGHTKPVTPQIQFSIIRLYFEQLAFLYPSSGINEEKLFVYPHHPLGSTKYMVYRAATEDSKDDRTIEGDLNPSPPKATSRIF